MSLGPVMAPIAAEAQPAGKVYRIGWLGTTRPTADTLPLLEAFERGLREQGYVEGQNLVIEWRYAEGRSQRFTDFAVELVRLKVDLIFGSQGRAIRAAKAATRTIPIVFFSVVDPVESGLVASFARPGGNLTGVASLGVELAPKRFELLRETIPGVSRVAVLWDGRYPRGDEAWKVAARSLGMTLLPLELRSAADLEGAFKAASKGQAVALVDNYAPLIVAHRHRIADLAIRHGLAWVAWDRFMVESGALMSYAANIADLYRQAGVYAGKILGGAKPGEMPIAQPMKFDLVINLKTAKALGLTIPQSVLLRADELIQ